MLKDIVMWSSNIFGMELCKYLSGLFFGTLYLYLWYNHTILVSNGCVGVLIHMVYLMIVYSVSKAI